MLPLNKLRNFLPLLTLFLPLQGQAARFANQFVEFEIPPQWNCTLEGAEWVCQSSDEGKKRDAVIILAAKLKGPQDSLDQYLEYLKNPKTFKSVQGRPVKSDPKYAKTINLNGQAWVDALHLESEVPGFYTRYLATIKQDIGVLVTYSINKTKYQNYLEPFENMVRTLRVFRKMGAPINTLGQADSNLFATGGVPAQVSESTIFPTAQPQGGSDQTTAKAPAKSGIGDDVLIYGGGAAVVLLLLWLRKRRQGGS